MIDTSLYDTDTVLNVLRVENLDKDRFVGKSHFMGSPRVFGGQVLGQSLYAASTTVDGRPPHSMHAMFLLPGDLHLPIEYLVERVRDGGTFSTRRVVATQEGRRLFVMSASFQAPEDGLSHQKSSGENRDPNTMPSSLESWKQRGEAQGTAYYPVPIDFRGYPDGDIFNAGVSVPHKRVWMRAPRKIDDDYRIHQALFAYVSDYGLLSTCLQPHGYKVGDPRLQLASLDHSIWFHRPFRMDDWLLFVMDSPNASGGRGLTLGHVYNRLGEMVATMAQEGMIRVRETR
ncbi:acyl-CoA thioesterase [Noviherbaspirillum aerium]|uniref:acyl-CoA thioesterase n=1 Tax=Noviherbaspirillum aerium TaxID=2588497 RepID=UPI00124D141A|nr:acyl-CoA thioesterase II [Noviherbaspirillum aerium]